MNKNDIFEIEITGMTDDGSGVGRAEGIAIFVPYTIMGELVRVHIIKVNRTYAIGKLLEVIRPSEHRVKTECEYFYKCGGCQLWHMDYDAELEFKQKKVEDCIKRIGGINTPISSIIGADDTSRYRNKMQMPVTNEGIGFYKRNSHNVIDMNDCLLQSFDANKVAEILRNWMQTYNIEAYNEDSDFGLIRNIYTRYGNSGILIVLVTTDKSLPHKAELIEALTSSELSVVGIIQNINSKKTNTVLGRENICLWGDNTIIDNIGNVEFEISPNSFYQVNKNQTEKLYSIAKDMASLKETDTIWDIYCGIGTIGQFIASDKGKIVGIEIVESAVENAKENAKRNGFDNAEYFCGSAESIAPTLIKKGYNADVVILDPPRKGCDEKLLDCVVSLKPKRIVYISCKPSTLARDLKYLASKGYKTQELVPVDMFPRTCHVECCALLCRC